MLSDTDIDECSDGVDLCEQHCVNTNGSYFCECSDGDVLHDGFNCRGKSMTVGTKLYLCPILQLVSLVRCVWSMAVDPMKVE